MRNVISILLFLCAVTTSTAQRLRVGDGTSGMRITREYNNVSLSDALRQLNAESTDYEINFLYNELEDFRITTTIRRKTVPDAIRQMIGFYPIRMSIDSTEITVECPQKTTSRYKGTIIDEQGQSVAYANIALLSSQDSTLITGGVSNESGLFVIPCEQHPVLARISYVGYKTIYKQCNNAELGTIRMQAETQTLKGVTVKGERPMYQTKGNSIITNVAGTFLERLHSTNELLLQVPGVIASPDGSLSVFGRGTPIYYINNRKVQNIQEISHLSPKDILYIELVRNPGVQYDAEVETVIKIITSTKEEGWTLQVKADEEVNDVLTSDESINLGLKRGGLNASAHLEYNDFHRHYNQPQIKEFVVDGDTYRYDHTDNHSREHQKIPSYSANVDYEFNERHIAG
ncbi:MAG: TonB-dependent receptor, partial [Prevotella sp.]|nr:TonB-dependent receptor [Prevotella sp.]